MEGSAVLFYVAILVSLTAADETVEFRTNLGDITGQILQTDTIPLANFVGELLKCFDGCQVVYFSYISTYTCTCMRVMYV